MTIEEDVYVKRTDGSVIPYQDAMHEDVVAYRAKVGPEAWDALVAEAQALLDAAMAHNMGMPMDN